MGQTPIARNCAGVEQDQEVAMKVKTIWTVLASAAVGVTAVVVSCGGGGGGGSGATTRFEGNVANATAFLAPSAPESRWAWLSPVGVAWAQVAGVQVCLQGTTTCTTTDANGAFVLDAGGDLVDPCLTFTATDFTGTVCISGTIPQGSVVRVGSIECSVSQGTCQADDLEIETPDATPSPSETPGADDDQGVSEPDDDVSGVSDDVSSPSSDTEGSDDDSSSSGDGGQNEPEDD
jgi:hypothetical protein